MSKYTVLIKAARSVTNADGSLRYDVGDLLPVGHPDVEVHLGDAARPTAFEVVDGGLIDTSERNRVVVPNGKVLGPRTIYGDTNTYGLWVTVGGKTAKQPGVPDDETPQVLTEPVSETPKKLETPPPPTGSEPARQAAAKKPPTRPADTAAPVPAEGEKSGHKAATLNDGGSGVEDTGQHSKGRHS